MYRIKDWDIHFENNRTKELKRLEWVPIPNKMDGAGYTELVDHPDGAAHFGAWVAMLEIASKQKVRGNLPAASDGIPQALARISRLPATLFEAVLPRLLKMQWIEQFGEIPHDGAGIPQQGAEIPALKGIELNGIEKNCTHPPTPRSQSEPNPNRASVLKLDDYWAKFEEAADACDMLASDLERITLSSVTWPRLSFEQKLQAVDTLNRRRESGEYQNGYTPNMDNYLRKRLWERADRPKRIDQKPTPEQKRTLIDSEFTRMMAAQEEREKRRRMA